MSSVHARPLPDGRIVVAECERCHGLHVASAVHWIEFLDATPALECPHCSDPARDVDDTRHKLSVYTPAAPAKPKYEWCVITADWLPVSIRGEALVVADALEKLRGVIGGVQGYGGEGNPPGHWIKVSAVKAHVEWAIRELFPSE